MIARAAIESWDSGQQPDLERLGRLIRDLSGGHLACYPVDTGENTYALLLSNVPLTPAEVDELWQRECDGGLPDTFDPTGQ